MQSIGFAFSILFYWNVHDQVASTNLYYLVENFYVSIEMHKSISPEPA